MIKCNVTITGTISRNGEIRKDKEGREFISFAVETVINAVQGINKTITVSMAMDSEGHTPLEFLREERIQAKGVLTIRKKGDAVYYNMSVTEVTPAENNEDSITGTMVFRGTLGGRDIQDKKGKKGDFCSFDAFSTDKDGENYVYTWVHFIDFRGAHPEWLQPKGGINAVGDVELSVYNDKVGMTCRVSSLSPWDRTVNA